LQQEDFIKRQIDQLGQVLGKILADLLGLKSRGLSTETIVACDLAMNDEPGLTIGDIVALQPDEVIEHLKEVKGLNVDNFEKLADILLVLSDDADRDGTITETKQRFSAVSLAIYEHLEKVSHTYSFDRHRKIEKIKGL
jgi:hypothetical protein